ncbi:MAG: ABC transporter ATP-binding protein [Bacteroidales bacterium]|jgi:ABC-2 type transport system ATP-binding protein|nr:ABC transporter ATP-binding protein [Bacteroidales bacterium]
MININNVTFGYKKKKNVIEELNLQIKEGYIHGLLGKNGTGKTTLLKLITGLLFADKGSIDLDGNNPQERKTKLLQQIFFLPEEFDEMRISIATYAKINGAFYPSFSQDDFEDYLNEFEVTDLRQSMKNLSYGTKKKVLIAFGLATHVKYVFLDEPTNGLDIPSKVQFRKIILRAVNEKTTLVISTHQVRDLHNLIDNIIIMDKAHLLLNASVAEITEKLWFGLAENNDSETTLYEEENVNGKVVVARNTFGKESNLDIELLFNAAFQSREVINELFNNNK